MTEYRDKQIVIVGAGSSGQGLARFFLSRGARVTISDRRPAEELSGLDPLVREGLRLDLGGHSEALFTDADLVVISPGVPLTVPALQKALHHGVPVCGEVEIAWRELTAPLIGITGTNGKSTVTTLVGDMLRRWGKQAFVGGNLGTPLIDAVNQDWDWLVVELSSFQLEAIERFLPRYGMLLNITEDHLDRYASMADYQAAKARLFENMTAGEVAVVNADDLRVMEVAGNVAATIVPFSGERILNEGMSLAADEIVWRWRGEESRFPTTRLQVRGQHNMENVMAALIPLLLEGCPPEIAWDAAVDFRGLPHRMELVEEWNGVRWYDDSKGTNIGSVVKSLSGLEAPVTLIAGGKDKMGDLTPLNDSLAAKVRHLVVMGEAAPRMTRAYQALTEIHRVDSMPEAVRLSAELTVPGGTVLLSPGCASFDMFASFAERGQVFAAEVRKLMQAKECSNGD